MSLPRGLRGRLLAATAALLVAVIAVVDLTAYLALSRHLTDRADRNLAAVIRRLDLEAQQPSRAPVSSEEIRQIIPSEIYIALYDADGGLVLRLLPVSLRTTSSPVVPPAGALPPGATTVPTADGAGLRVSPHLLPPGESVPVHLNGHTSQVTAIVIGVSLSENADTLRRLLLVQVPAGLAALGLLVAGSWLILTLGLRPLQDMAQTARDIAGGDARRRVRVGDPRSDTGAVATALNEAFDARERSDGRTRAFVADASHELRTPLATIHGWADLYLNSGLSEWEDVDLAMQRIRDEAARMTALVDQLLTLARSDSGVPLHEDTVDLAVLCAEGVESARVAHPGLSATLVSPAVAVVPGDTDALRRVLDSLVVNAVTHTPAGTAITVTVQTEDRTATVIVADEGPGLPAASLDRAFDRFWRGDPGRGPVGAPGHGTGLGLAIARDVTRAHGGTLHLSPGPTSGLEAHLVLPTGSARGVAEPPG